MVIPSRGGLFIPEELYSKKSAIDSVHGKQVRQIDPELGHRNPGSGQSESSDMLIPVLITWIIPGT